jgi:polysaccharide transporter, PST family
VTLIKTSFLNGIAVGVKILTSIILNKVLAVYVGPSGYAVIGQFQNFITMLTTVASGAFNTGVTKYTAEYFDDEDKQRLVWSTAGTIAVISSFFIGLILMFFRVPLSEWLLYDTTYSNIFIWLGLTLILFVLNRLLVAILNGKKEIKRLVSVNILSSLVSLLITGILVVFWGLYGALIAMTINQSVILIVSLAICYRADWFNFKSIFGRIDKDILSKLGKFSLMALVSAVSLPVAQVIIRKYLGSEFGLVAAGHWEAMMRISAMYLMMVTGPLGIYYLPRLSEIRERSELRKEVIHGYKIILPIVILGSVIIYYLREWIVLTLFTEEFLPMVQLFAWQMAGDTVKIGSWLLAYLMLGRAMTETFIITELAFTVSWILFVIIFTGQIGVQGAQLAYFVNYILYWVVMWIFMKRYVF